MLPFLKKKPVAGVIIAHRQPDQGPEEKPESEENHALMSAAEDIITAVESRDKKRLAAALQAAFEICDSAPHVEGEPLEEEN